MWSPTRVAVLGVVLTFAASVSLAERPLEPLECQYVHVVDPCQKKLFVFDVEPPQIQHGISLDGGDAGAFDPGGIDFATVPEYGADFSFVTQGWFLRVIDQTEDTPQRTVDLRDLPDLSDFWSLNVDAATPVLINSENRYPLYVVGGRAGEPWLAILDQEVLLAETLDPSALVLASGPLCLDGAECVGGAMDIATSGFLLGAGIQEAYASVFNVVDGLAYQQFYRVDLQVDFTFNVVLEPWNDEGEPFSASAPLALGVDYDGDGLQPFGVFQTSSVVADLTNGDSSCPLPGDPTDVAVWGPGSGLDNPFFHFVTSSDPGGPGLLLGFPAGECPSDSEEFLTLQVGGLPHALGLSSDTSSTPWVYTANKEHGISAVHLWISPDGSIGDRIRILDDSVLDLPFEGCPARLSIRDEGVIDCADFPVGEPKPPKVDCDVDPDDPRCSKTHVDFGEE